MTGIFLDSEMPDCVVRSEDGARELHMTRATFQHLMTSDALGRVSSIVEGRADGSYRVPRVFGDRDIADEIELMLTYAYPEASPFCVLPTCGQPSVGEHRGFPLCEAHSEAMQGWDELLTATP